MDISPISPTPTQSIEIKPIPKGLGRIMEWLGFATSIAVKNVEEDKPQRLYLRKSELARALQAKGLIDKQPPGKLSHFVKVHDQAIAALLMDSEVKLDSGPGHGIIFSFRPEKVRKFQAALSNDSDLEFLSVDGKDVEILPKKALVDALLNACPELVERKGELSNEAFRNTLIDELLPESKRTIPALESVITELEDLHTFTTELGPFLESYNTSEQQQWFDQWTPEEMYQSEDRVDVEGVPGGLYEETKTDLDANIYEVQVGAHAFKAAPYDTKTRDIFSELKRQLQANSRKNDLTDAQCNRACHIALTGIALTFSAANSAPFLTQLLERTGMDLALQPSRDPKVVFHVQDGKIHAYQTLFFTVENKRFEPAKKLAEVRDISHIVVSASTDKSDKLNTIWSVIK